MSFENVLNFPFMKHVDIFERNNFLSEHNAFYNYPRTNKYVSEQITMVKYDFRYVNRRNY